MMIPSLKMEDNLRPVASRNRVEMAEANHFSKHVVISIPLTRLWIYITYSHRRWKITRSSVAPLWKTIRSKIITFQICHLFGIHPCISYLADWLLLSNFQFNLFNISKIICLTNNSCSLSLYSSYNIHTVKISISICIYKCPNSLWKG